MINTDTWEQRKFGDIGSIAMCKRIFKEQTSDEGEVPFYKIGTFGVEPDAFISKELFDEYKTKYPYPNKGDILISASGSIGRTVEFTGKDEYFQDSNIVWLKHGNEIDNSFLKVLYSIVEWSCEGSTIKRLYNDNFLKTEFMLPQIDEQIKLGTYFSNLDNLITLHQRKCDETKKLKKFMLQKMFPKKDAKKPEIRFAGFTDDWEQRKFGSLLKEIREKTKIENEDTLLSCAIDGMYLNSELFSHFRGSSNIGYLKVKKNDLILSAQNLHLGNCNVNLRFEHGIISPAYKVYELVTCDPFFIQAWVKQDSTKDFFLNASTEGASVCRKNIVWDELYKQTLPIPKLKEQEQIGQYFNELDNLITLHQRKLFLNFAKRNDWEQRKLGEVFQEYSEKNHPELPALTIIQGGGTVLREESERKLQYDKSSLAGYKMVREDDFIVHLRSFEGGLEKSNHNGLISPAYHTFHGDEVDSRFYYPYFRSYEFIKHKLVPHVYGIRDGRSIDIDSMKTIEIPWTSYEEQKKIGDYIESLDTLITLHRRAYYNKKGGLTNVHNDNQQHYAIL